MLPRRASPEPKCGATDASLFRGRHTRAYARLLQWFALPRVRDSSIMGLVMAVENRIVKVQKRNRALVRFDESRIHRAILGAAQSLGGFQQRFAARRQRGDFRGLRRGGRADRAIPGRRRRGVPQFGSAPSDSQFPADDRADPGRRAARPAQLWIPEHGGRLRLLSLGPALAAGRGHYARQVRGQRFSARRRWNGSPVEPRARRATRWRG